MLNTSSPCCGPFLLIPVCAWHDYCSWSASSGASGRIEYFASAMGTAVPEEEFEDGVAGVRGIRRRVVFANGNMDCANDNTFPTHTSAHRNQTAGVSFTNTFILALSFKARQCAWYDSLLTPVSVNPAGFLWMWTDEE